jgi:hypothetical protein
MKLKNCIKLISYLDGIRQGLLIMVLWIKCLDYLNSKHRRNLTLTLPSIRCVKIKIRLRV